LFVCLLATFTYFTLSSQADSRRQAQDRFTGAASIAAQLTSSLVVSSVPGAQASATRTFGGASISGPAVDAVARKSGLAYLLVLDSHGKVIGSSSSPAAAARAVAIASGTHVTDALAGHATFSDLIPATSPSKGYLLEWAIPFETPAGRRVEVEAVSPNVLTGFFDSYLAKVQSASGGAAAFILDSQGREVGAGTSTGATAPPLGAQPKSTGLLAALATKPSGSYRYNGADRYFASSPVEGTTWRVVLGLPKNSLYPALAGTQSWYLYSVLVAFGVAGALSLGLFRRSVGVGVALREANNELTTINATLEERVAERTASAEERAKELARSNAELEQFSSIASHDLQEPLRKIRMFGDRLREKLGEELADEPADDLARIENAATRMQRLINDLLEFSRVSHRGNAFETVDLGELVTEVTSDLDARVIELGAHVDVGEMPVIEADRLQMRQLFQNLIGNALKFHRDGEAPVVHVSSVVIDASQPRFPGESGAAGRAMITVADNGIGFDEKHSERVFGAFERLHNRSAYEGTGIGLSIARKIVWRHGGHISAAGVPNEGATFTVTLPLLQSTDTNAQNGDARR
jgi:signal transduction histidine kinase